MNIEKSKSLIILCCDNYSCTIIHKNTLPNLSQKRMIGGRDECTVQSMMNIHTDSSIHHSINKIIEDSQNNDALTIDVFQMDVSVVGSIQ